MSWGRRRRRSALGGSGGGAFSLWEKRGRGGGFGGWRGWLEGGLVVLGGGLRG